MMGPLQPALAQFGVAATFATDTELGAQASYYRPIEISGFEGLRAGGDLTLYLPQSVNYGGEFARVELTYTYFEFNGNGQYDLQEQEERRIYALGGINYSWVTVSGGDDVAEVGWTSGGDAGFNVGAGGELVTGFGRLFGEAKLTLGGFGQLGILAGLRFGGGE